MGNSNSVAPTSDARVEKVQKRLHLTTEDLNVLFLRFSKYDREGNGMITREDFFTKFLEEKRSFFGDAVFNLVECENEEVVTFGEFTEALTTYCLFETNDILKLCFNIFDTEKTGFIDKDEIKHFLLMLHGGDVKSNGRKGLEMIENSTRQDGRVGFPELKELHKHFPMLLYPVFRMQNTLIRESLGDSWWKKKKAIAAEEMRIERNKMRNLHEVVDEKELERQAEILEVKRFMGIVKYYLMPWKREKVLKKIKKLKKIEAELQAREEFEEAED